MDYEEFVALCDKITSEVPYDWEGDIFYIQNGNIVQKHEVGGAQGGNCWGDDAEYYSSNKPKKAFLPLDAILKAVKPEISYLSYKEIEALFVSDDYCDHEWYGNHINYDLTKLDISKLYDVLFK